MPKIWKYNHSHESANSSTKRVNLPKYALSEVTLSDRESLVWKLRGTGPLSISCIPLLVCTVEGSNEGVWGATICTIVEEAIWKYNNVHKIRIFSKN